ncbi:MAG: DUF1016 family protein [Spirochaetales bacterium]|nr:DUF1016 family protein [Spirochaetales bacterium]
MSGKVLQSDYLETLVDLKERIRKAQYNSFSAVNSEMILAYLDIGKILSKKTKEGWGSSVIKKLSIDLQSEFVGVKGFSDRNLRRMKQIYEELMTDSIWPQAVAKLPWGHTTLIFSKIKGREERLFYLDKAREEGWSRVVLEEKIKLGLYENHNSFQSNFALTVPEKDITQYRLHFKDEYNLSFLDLEDRHTEKQLEEGIVKNITKMLGQFGHDFTFMGRQFRLELDDKEYFIDILFYHRKLKSMIAMELKVNEFKPEYSQQLNWYLHLLDKTVKYPDDNPSIGILLCKSKSKLTVEYALELVNRPMGVTTYRYSELPKEIAINLPDEAAFENILGQNWENGDNE